MPDLRKILRVALFVAVFLYFAAPLVLAAGGPDRGASAGIQGHCLRKSVMVIKDVSIEVAGYQRAGKALVTRLSLEAVLGVTQLLDRLGALTVTFVDVPDVEAGRRR